MSIIVLWFIVVQTKIDYFQGMFDEEMHSMLDIALCLGLVEIGFNQLLAVYFKLCHQGYQVLGFI